MKGLTLGLGMCESFFGTSSPPVASFPQVISHADTVNSSSSVTSLSINMPATYAAGDLLVSIGAVDGNATLSGSGWTILSNESVQPTTGHRRVILTRVATGGDTLTIDHGGAGERDAFKTLALSAGSTLTLGNFTTGADADSLTYGAAANTLWLVVASSDGNTADVGTGSAPSGYAFIGSVAKSGTSTADVAVHVASRELEAATEDPGAFSAATAANFRSQLIGVRF